MEHVDQNFNLSDIFRSFCNKKGIQKYYIYSITQLGKYSERDIRQKESSIANNEIKLEEFIEKY